MLRRIAIFMALTLIFSLGGYAIYYCNPSPERVVIRLLHELQDGDIKGAEHLCTAGLGLDSTGRQAKKLYRAMFGTMQFVIIDSTIEEQNAKVDVTITMIDMEKQVTAITYQLLDSSLSGKSADKKLYQLLTEQIEAYSDATVTNTVTVQIIRDEKNRWRIDSSQNNEFLVAITGGIGPF